MRIWANLVAAIVLTGGVSNALATDRLGVRPGMNISEVETVLQGRCSGLSISGDTERFVICSMGQGPEAAEIRATISPVGRTYYVAWHETSPTDVNQYTRELAGDLGFSGPGRDCRFYDYQLRCWTAENGTVLYTGERDARQRYVSYLVNDTIETEDYGQ